MGFFCIKWRSGICYKWNRISTMKFTANLLVMTARDRLSGDVRSCRFSFLSLTAVDESSIWLGPRKGPLFYLVDQDEARAACRARKYAIPCRRYSV
jgi:hypothetical protein